MAAVDRFEAAKPNSHHPRLFAHWSQITQPLTIKMIGSRVTGDCHARF